jgi:hypothetical protein
MPQVPPQSIPASYPAWRWIGHGTPLLSNLAGMTPLGGPDQGPAQREAV